MSREGVTQVLTKAAEDPDFKQRAQQDPSLLDQYDLTDEEKEALRNRDHESLEAMGVDQRQTKWMAAKPT